MLTLETKEYGTLEYEKEYCINLPDGLFGFPEYHDYLPLCLNDEEDNTLLVLQSVEDAHIGFVVINPFVLDPDYQPELTPEELDYLGADSESMLTFYVICVLRDDYMENTVNMKCPIVVNPDTRLGMQVILNNSAYDFRQKLSSFSILKREAETDADTAQEKK